MARPRRPTRRPDRRRAHRVTTEVDHGLDRRRDAGSTRRDGAVVGVSTTQRCVAVRRDRCRSVADVDAVDDGPRARIHAHDVARLVVGDPDRVRGSRHAQRRLTDGEGRPRVSSAGSILDRVPSSLFVTHTHWSSVAMPYGAMPTVMLRHHVARRRVDPRDGPVAAVGDPDRPEPRRDPRRAGADRDRVHRPKGHRVDLRHLAVRRVRHPQEPLGLDDAVRERAHLHVA